MVLEVGCNREGSDGSIRTNPSEGMKGAGCQPSGRVNWGGYQAGERNPTLLQVLLLGLAAHPGHARHRLHVALADRRRMQDGLGGPSQADRQASSTQQDPSHPWVYRKGAVRSGVPLGLNHPITCPFTQPYSPNGLPLRALPTHLLVQW